MGLTARVMCRCFADGKVASPFPGQIKLDEEGYLHLDLPREGHEEEHILFRNWLDSGCEHPRMVYASDVINWTAYRSFQQALASAGWEHFPTLKAELPDNENRTTPANAASAMLAELSFFAERADLGWTTVLVDTDTGEELHEYIAAYGGEFKYGQSGHDIGVDAEGFFIRRRAEGESMEVFRAKRVEQAIPDLDSTRPDYGPMVEYVDLDSGRRYRCSEPTVKIAYWPDGKLQNTAGEIRLVYPVRMHINKRKKESSELASVTDSLRTIFEAALQTGNPIRW